MSCTIIPSVPLVSLRDRKEFHRATKNVNESLSDWILRINVLAKSCQYGHHTQLFVIEKFLIGLEDEWFEQMCPEQITLCWQQLQELVQHFEQDKLKQKDLPSKEVDRTTLQDMRVLEDSTIPSKCLPKRTVRRHSTTTVNNADPPVETITTFKFDVFETAESTEIVLKEESHHEISDLEEQSTKDEEETSLNYEVNTQELEIEIDDNLLRSSPDNNRLEKSSNYEIERVAAKRSSKAKSKVNSALECSYCNKILTTKGMLERHFRCHLKRTLCPVCNKVFKSNGDMKIHLSGHDGAPEFEKKFTCHVCGKRFNRNADLLKHVKVHTNERPFSCLYCGKAFARKDKLKQHVDLHLGYRPHICTYCNKTFSQKTHLNEHIRKHTGERPYKCKCCDKSYSTSRSLKGHLNTHQIAQFDLG